MDNNEQKLQKEIEHFQNSWVCQLLDFPTDHYFSWVNIPRYINDLFEHGVINYREKVLYILQRADSLPYGYAITSTDKIHKDIFNKEITKDSINTYLRHLRNLRLIWYEDRNGKAGDFEVHFDDFFLPNDQKTNLMGRFTSSSKGSDQPGKPTGKSLPVKEVTKQVTEEIRRSNEPVVTTNSTNKQPQQSTGFVGNNTYTNTETKTDTFNIESSMSYKEEDEEKKPYDPKIKTDTFNSDSYASIYHRSPYEIEELQKIALHIHDPYMDFLLGKYEKLGFGLIQDAYNQYLEDEKNPKVSITFPPRYFNSKINKLYMDRQKSKIGNIK